MRNVCNVCLEDVAARIAARSEARDAVQRLRQKVGYAKTPQEEREARVSLAWAEQHYAALQAQK